MDMNPVAPTAPAAPAATFAPTIEPSMPIELTPAQEKTVREDIQHAASKGWISPEQESKGLDEIQVPAADRLPDARSPEVQLLDQHFPIAKPEEFMLAFSDEELPTEGRTSVRTWLGPEGVGADRTSGNTLVKTVDEIGRQLAAMPEAQRLEYSVKQLSLLKEQYGESLDARFAQAKALIGVLESKRPGLSALLQSGVGDSARVVSLIFDLSERWAMRRKG